MDAFGHRLGTGGLDGRPAIREHGGENGDHLTIGVIGSGESAANPLQRPRRSPILEWRSIPERAGFAGQDRHVMPWIVDCLAAPMVADVFRDNATILANDDAI